jgi:hypothetical protein
LFWVAVLLAALLAVSSFQVETENAARTGSSLASTQRRCSRQGGRVAVQLAVLEVALGAASPCCTTSSCARSVCW